MRKQTWRIAFFLFLCFAMVAPMIQMFYLHGVAQAWEFVCTSTLHVTRLGAAPFGL